MGTRSKEILDMVTPRQSALDVRMFFVDRDPEEWAPCRWNRAVDYDDIPHFYMTSNVSSNDICYTVEALYYAQSGYLITIVVVQWSDLMICKTRNLSISQQGMINNNANFALFFETALVAILCYVPFLNTVLGTRMIAFPHFGIPAMSFFMVIIFMTRLERYSSVRVWSSLAQLVASSSTVGSLETPTIERKAPQSLSQSSRLYLPVLQVHLPIKYST